MEKIEKMLPKNFEIVNGINYFRLEDGRVAVEKTSNITINSSKEDIVELITLEYNSKTVRFWRTNDKLYALASSSCVTIPDDTTFMDCYSSNNYHEGQYVKYMSSKGCGIIYVSETEVSHVISYESSYTEICFENNLFYAVSKEGDKKYHIIGESSKLLGTFPSKCKKLDRYMLFYDDYSIFVDSSQFDIPNGISSVEVIKQREITLVKVVNSNGIYYYTKGIEYLFGPIRKDEIHGIDNKSCFVYEVVNKAVIQVFYIDITEETYICKSLSSQKGIECPIFNSKSNGKFFVADNVLYVLKDKEFTPLIEGINTNQYVLYDYEDIWGRGWSIVGFLKNIPVYHAYYSAGNSSVWNEGTLERIANGYMGSHICRKGNHIVIIELDGKLVLDVKGENCYKKKYRYKSIYVIEEEEENIELYWSNGTKV